MSRGAPLEQMFSFHPHWRGRRLILHAGAPKTGTTSLQHFLDFHREALALGGVLYPREGTADYAVPKHQWLNRHLYAEPDEVLLAARIAKCLNEGDGNAHTLILSTEGIFNHWWDYSDDAKQWLTALSAFFDLRCAVWLREPAAFFRSYYVQSLKNPAGIAGNGQDLSASELLAIPRISRHFDYDLIIEDMSGVFGKEKVFPFAYSEDILADFMALIGQEKLMRGAHTRGAERRNVTDFDAGTVSLLRSQNAAMHPESAGDHVALERRDEATGARTPAAPFRLDDAAVRRVRALCPATLESLGHMGALSKQRWHDFCRSSSGS